MSVTKQEVRYENDAQEQSAIERILSLMARGHMCWKCDYKTYSAKYKKLTFTVYDYSGQGLLIINRSDGTNIATITDTTSHNSAGQLLANIKVTVLASRGTHPTIRHDRGLAEVLNILTEEA